MKVMNKWIGFFMSTLLIACAVSDREVDGPVYCTIDQTDTYQLGTNPSADFNVTNITKTRVFNNTDCPRINNDSYTKFISRAKRVGNGLQVFDGQYQSGQFLLEMEVSGTNLLPVKRHVNISNCSIIREWNGTLDAPGTTMTIHELVTYKGGCESTFYNPEFDTTHP